MDRGGDYILLEKGPKNVAKLAAVGTQESLYVAQNKGCLALVYNSMKLAGCIPAMDGTRISFVIIKRLNKIYWFRDTAAEFIHCGG